MRNAREPSEETAKDTMVCTVRYCSSKAVRTATYGTYSIGSTRRHTYIAVFCLLALSRGTRPALRLERLTRLIPARSASRFASKCSVRHPSHSLLHSFFRFSRLALRLARRAS